MAKTPLQLQAPRRGETAGVPEGFVADAPFSLEEVAAEDPLTNKAWSHLAMTYDGAAIRLYVNGELVDTNSAIPSHLG
jgi:hypothetical protein